MYIVCASLLDTAFSSQTFSQKNENFFSNCMTRENRPWWAEEKSWTPDRMLASSTEPALCRAHMIDKSSDKNNSTCFFWDTVWASLRRTWACLKRLWSTLINKYSTFLHQVFIQSFIGCVDWMYRNAKVSVHPFPSLSNHIYALFVSYGILTTTAKFLITKLTVYQPLPVYAGLPWIWISMDIFT